MTHFIILGIVQGLTEFLPISSSGHLILLPSLLGWEASGLAVDVALNTGTFAAAFLYFLPVWWRLLTKGILQRQPAELRLLGLLILATVPAALIGYFGEGLIIGVFRQPMVAASMLILFGLLLWVAERSARLDHSLKTLTWKQSLVIGLSQALALIPGVSRSGITMTSSLWMGLTKEDAAQFSFLLLAPVSLGAVLLQGQSILESPNTTEMAIGAFVSFIVGLSAIHLLLKFLKKYGFAPYIWYRIVVGVFFLLYIALQ